MIRNIIAILFVLFTLSACHTKGMNGSEAGLNGEEAGVIVPGTEADLVANVGDRIYFAFDSSAIDDEARVVLDRQAAWLKTHHNVNVAVEGHADERGTREYNLALGERRAESVKRYLVHAGVDAARVTTISYGKERPAVLGTGEAVWRLNRRGVTVVNNQ